MERYSISEFSIYRCFLSRTNYVRVRLQLDAVAATMSAARKCWLLVNTSQSQVIADLVHIISHRFQVASNCSLYLDDYWLPPGESTMILKDDDIIRYLFIWSGQRTSNSVVSLWNLVSFLSNRIWSANSWSFVHHTQRVNQ